jgi:hypothetical protein
MSAHKSKFHDGIRETVSLSLLRNHSCLLLQGNELESEASGFGAQVSFLAFAETDLVPSKGS